MRKKKLLAASIILGLGLTVGLLWLLSRVPLPAVRAVGIDDVDTTNDGVAPDGNCTLREAIIAANTNSAVDQCAAGSGADVVTLTAGTYVLTVTGTGEELALTGDLDITEALTIVGAGPGLTTIDASGVISDRVFDIRPGVGSVVISGVTIMNGNIVAGNGGGIRNEDADLALINSVVSNNVVTGPLDNAGGGVYIGSGSATLEGVKIVSNTADYGGGVFIESGSVTFKEGRILGNGASRYGGGVYVTEGSATLQGGQVVSNTAVEGGGGVCIGETNGTFTQTGGIIALNTANANGGGLQVQYGSAALNGGQIISNTANANGGGIYNASTLTISHCTFANNRTTDNGGGIGNSGVATVNNSTFYDNEADLNGGGVYNDEGTLVVNNSTFSGNRASEGAFDNYGGGGICNMAEDGPAELTINNCTITGNSAMWGGGIANDAGAVDVKNTIIADNTVHAGGAGPNCDSNNTITTSYNLESGTDCGFTGTGDLQNTDPDLRSLRDNGGPTWTHAPAPGSPVIDRGDPAFTPPPAYDQRGPGFPRVVNGRIDIGAYEAWLQVFLPLVMRNLP